MRERAVDGSPSGRLRADRLRNALLDAEFNLTRNKERAVLIIATAVPAAGRTEAMHTLLDWFDPKHVVTSAWGKRNDEEKARPRFWRYWNALPRKGQIAVWFDGWYGDLLQLAMEQRSQERVVELARAIKRQERMLIADGVRILRCHFGIDEETQKERIADLLDDPLTRWRVTKQDKWAVRHHSRLAAAHQLIQGRTEHRDAPWLRLRQGHEHGAWLKFAGALERLMRARPVPRHTRLAPAGALPRLPTVPATRRGDAEYERELEQLQATLAHLSRRKAWQKRAAVLVFEGMDAAGKSGVIKRITASLDTRQYRVVPVGAPDAEEKEYPYLWRFWRRLPSRGGFTIYDRSWYGRVLVERVRGFASAPDWRRAYEEIVEFERLLAAHDVIVLKFWLSISKAEQAKRFEARETQAFKRFKVDPEDWENRRHWAAFQHAAREMIARTSTTQNPWTIIPADHKHVARLTVLDTVCARMGN
jgi:AMP-polyphosphate phosphotransferase